MLLCRWGNTQCLPGRVFHQLLGSCLWHKQRPGVGCGGWGIVGACKGTACHPPFPAPKQRPLAPEWAPMTEKRLNWGRLCLLRAQ